MTKSRYAVLIWAFLLSVFLFVGTASAGQYSINGTTYPMIYNGTYASQNINYMVYYSNGYDFFWNGGLIQTVWDGIYAYDRIAFPENGTAISPWAFWHVESYNPINKKWGETIPISNQFIKIDNSTLKRVMVMGSGEKFNITYHNYGTKIKQDLELTAASARIYRLTYRIDSVASQDVNVDTKKFTPGFFNNFTLFDITDVQPFTVNRTFNETSGLWEGDGSYLYGWNTTTTIDNTNRKMYFTLTNNQVLSIGQKVNIDPLWSTNGSTTPAWQNTTLTNTHISQIDNNIILGNSLLVDGFDTVNLYNYTKTVSVSYGNSNISLPAPTVFFSNNSFNGNSIFKVSYKYPSTIRTTVGIKRNETTGVRAQYLHGLLFYDATLYQDESGTLTLRSYPTKPNIDYIAEFILNSTGTYVYVTNTSNSIRSFIYSNTTLTNHQDYQIGADHYATPGDAYLNFFELYDNKTSGYIKSWYNSTPNETYQIDVNGSNATNSNVSLQYAQNGSSPSGFVSPENTSLNASWSLNPQYTNTDIYLWLFGNGTSTSQVSNITFFDQAAGDTTSPTYSGASHNQTIAGLPTLFSIQYNDETALHPNGQYIFATNNTGEWSNESAVNWTAKPEWANVTKTLNSTVDTVIGYRWYANDSAGNANNTPVYTLTVTILPAPNITSWNNNYTNSNSLDIVVELFSSVLFNATSNQTIDTWNWYFNGNNQNNNYDNFSYYFNKTGYYELQVNATNVNGTSDIVQWNNTVKQVPEVNVSVVIT